MALLCSDYSTAVCSIADIASDIETLRSAYDTNSQTFTSVQRSAIVSIVDNLQKRVNDNPATDLQNTNDSILYIEDEIKKAKEDLTISQDRVKTIRNPDTSQSYYESWFPINRPLRNSTMIIALAFGIFFFFFFFLISLNSFGFEFIMNITWANPETYAKMARLFPFVGIVFIIGLIILAVLVYLRKI